MVTVISHFFNEAFLLPYWLKWHTKLFDHGILIDYHSTDDSVEIIKDLAPHWEVRTSRNPDFAAIPVDQEVMAIEREISGWKIALNTTEFMFHHDLRGYLAELEPWRPEDSVLAIQSVVMGDRAADSGRELQPDEPLFLQCRHGFVDRGWSSRSPRYLHRMPDGAYTAGRHHSAHSTRLAPELLYLWFGWAPWPQQKERKLQIQSRIPAWDRALGHGIQHFTSAEGLERSFQITQPYLTDLWHDPQYRQNLEAIATRYYPGKLSA